MAKSTFDVKHTNIAKGFFILAMVFHHVFASQMNYWLNLSTWGEGETSVLLTDIALYGKVCVGGFVFLSGYGITKKLMSCEADPTQDKKLIISRLTKLYFGFWPIYIIGIIGTMLFGNTPLTDYYISATGKFSWIMPILDALGLAKLFNSGTLNSSWWYLPVAIIVIFATPLCYKLYCNFRCTGIWQKNSAIQQTGTNCYITLNTTYL